MRRKKNLEVRFFFDGKRKLIQKFNGKSLKKEKSDYHSYTHKNINIQKYLGTRKYTGIHEMCCKKLALSYKNNKIHLTENFTFCFYSDICYF